MVSNDELLRTFTSKSSQRRLRESCLESEYCQAYVILVRGFLGLIN